MSNTKIGTAFNDVRALVNDANDLFHEATSATAENATDLRNRGIVLLDNALLKAHQVPTSANSTGKEALDCTNDYVQQNPWRAVSISAGVGLVLGFLLTRK